MSVAVAERTDHPRPAGDVRVERLWEAPTFARRVRGAGMPDELRSRYGGPLELPLRNDRPLVVANFVSTLDGVVALGTGPLGGGGLISGHFEPDRFLMGLLRAAADVVVVGAGTLRRSTSQRWTAGHVHPPSNAAFAAWRESMNLVPNPATIVVTATGDLPAEHPALTDSAVPVVVATTPGGARRASTLGLAPHVAVESIGDGRSLTGEDVVAVAACLGARVALCEGGPHLLGELVAADVLDELFLTLAPQLVGRGDCRLGLVEGIELEAGDGRWHELTSVSHSGEHVFLRYRRRQGPERKES